MTPPAHPWLAPPSTSLRYRVISRAFAVASAVHLTLPDVFEDGWLGPNLVYWTGVVLLALWGSLAGWLLAIVGLALPLWLLGDQLTQSAYLLLFAVAAVGCFVGRRDGRDARLDAGLGAAVRLLTVVTYALAAFHKLNDGFLDPEVSCATGGLHILAENWGVPALAMPSLDGVWPWLFLAAEISVVALLVVRPAAAMILALLMHIPLTIVFAPSFAFVMLAGWTAFFTERDLRHLGGVMRARWRWILPIGAGLGLASFAAYMRTHRVVYPWWQLKEILLWVGLAWLVASWLKRPGDAFGWFGAFRERAGSRRRWVVSIAVAWLLAGLTPYTGASFHHAGAMLSNLRIDEGCWNSVVVPESVRLFDPYIRVDDVEVQGPMERHHLERTEARLLHGLWNRRSLAKMRDDACRLGAAPLRLTATQAEQTFLVEDLCAQWPFGEEPLPGVARYQSNLLRDCPQACIH